MNKKIYPSKYTDKKVTAAQYLCDEIMERMALKAGKTLPYKYWSTDQWNKLYKWQIVAANDLLLEADCVSIMTFLRSLAGKKILSLGQKKQILDGINKTTKVIVQAVKAGVPNKNGDVFLEDVVIEMVIDDINSYETKVSLWEKLS